MDAYVPKPVEINPLLAAIRSVLKPKPSRT